MELDFEVDKITESIENAETGETLDTLVLPVTKADLEEVRGEMMIAIDTDEKFKWFLDALESDDFQVVSRKWTEEEKAELSRLIAKHRAM